MPRTIMIMATASFLIGGCTADGECGGGSIAVQDTTRAAPQGSDADLVAEFGFTAEDFAQAVAGTWADTAAGLEFTVSIPEGAVVHYELAAGGSTCLSHVELALTGSVGAGDQRAEVEAFFETGGNLDTAVLRAAFGGTEQADCVLDFAPRSGGELASLTGHCGLDVIGRAPQELVFRR